MSFRELGHQALGTVLKQTKNVKIIERYIFENSEYETSNEEELEVTYKQNVYQVVSDIMEKIPLNQILSNTKGRKLGWRHTNFDQLYILMEEQDSFIENPFEVAEGALECTKCKSKRVYYYQKQCRGSDEPMTTFATCVKCGNKWTYSG